MWNMLASGFGGTAAQALSDSLEVALAEGGSVWRVSADVGGLLFVVAGWATVKHAVRPKSMQEMVQDEVAKQLATRRCGTCDSPLSGSGTCPRGH